MPLFTEQQLAFVHRQRVGRFATVDATGQPHAIPVCYAWDGQVFYIALDAKPKRVDPRQLKRVRNVLENPRVALVLDHYSEEWADLAYLLIRGVARVIDPGNPQHEQAIRLLRARYAQYHTMPIEAQPVIAIQPERVVGWGLPEN